MAELNDKLITYGNLSTFYDKLQEQGLGGNAIEDASVFPDASENKSKLIRLESDDNVYVSELKSRTSTTTNRLPDEQQIDKAYLYEGVSDFYYYKGAYTIIFDDTEINGYGWLEDLGEGGWYFILTEDNAENVQSNSIAYGILASEDADVIDLVNKTVTTNKTSNSTKHTLNDIDGESTQEHPVIATYNAPEANQIGNAYITEASTDNFIYTGETVIYNDENWYKWNNVTQSPLEYNYIITNKKASEMYGYHNEAADMWENDATFLGYNGSTFDEVDKFSLNIYIPQLNAPDSEQVGNAYVKINWNEDDSTTYVYKGETTIHCTDGDYITHEWLVDGSNRGFLDDTFFTTYNANSLYGNSSYVVTNGDNYWGSLSFDGTDWDCTLTVSGFTSIFSENSYDMFEDVAVYSHETSTVKYQRTESIEVWDWQPLTDNATNDDIDLMFANEIKLIRAQEDDENYIDWLVNTSGETMEFNGQTYYKWVIWANDFNDGSGPAVEETNRVVLTNTLNIRLPFNSDSPEFEYSISIDGEEMSSEDYIHGDYTQKTVQ